LQEHLSTFASAWLDGRETIKIRLNDGQLNVAIDPTRFSEPPPPPPPNR
jgi:hypothetical protein